jgi:hypothetical protein
MGFSQRQAGGKFTRDEAQAFIDRLEAEEDEAQQNAEPSTSEPAFVTPSEPAFVTPSEAEHALRDFSSEDLAAELRRRGWFVGDD